MSESDVQLPSSIRRPLLGAALGLLAFLAVFVAWAIFAPLATTVSINGTLRSSKESYALQHPYGGLVKEVLVELHDDVEQDQLLLRLDTDLDKETLAIQVSMRDRLLQENMDVSTFLANEKTVQTANFSSLNMRRQQVELQVATAKKNNLSIKQQIGALQAKIRYAELQLDQMTGRAKRYASLTSQGFARVSDNEHLEEQVLLVRGEIEADRATVYDLQGQVQRNQLQQRLTRVAFEHELTSLRERNLAQLDQLESVILDLEDRIERSDVRAPADGVVASLPISAEHMLATKGATLLVLAKPLQEARVTFDIPVNFIDQIHPGMSARLIIPSLPQRQMPKIDVQIEAISPRANLDEFGNPTSFSGLAIAPFDVLERLNGTAGIRKLSEDMPVTLIVSVRETTFANYLVAPFLSAFSRALQD